MGLNHGECRFDFPGEWGSLLQDLADAAAWAAPSAPEAKGRALLALKNVVRALRGKRIVVEGRKGEDLQPLADRIARERALMNQRAEAILAPMVSEWEQNFAATLQVVSCARRHRCLHGLLGMWHHGVLKESSTLHISSGTLL